MSHLWTAHRIRTRRSHRHDHEPHTLLDILMDGDGTQPPHQLPAPPDRQQHPVLIHILGTYLSVASLLAAVIAAHTHPSR
ncbi:hypothetical protein ACIQNU_31535 [Streptomyces sp. NPDC091292]|uniref:hypothetical protein n=1 Tax=Streptomyces sp. NPDC091292 TaxID=3365991 RepID=UPI00380039C5